MPHSFQLQRLFVTGTIKCALSLVATHSPPRVFPTEYFSLFRKHRFLPGQALYDLINSQVVHIFHLVFACSMSFYFLLPSRFLAFLTLGEPNVTRLRTCISDSSLRRSLFHGKDFCNNSFFFCICSNLDTQPHNYSLVIAKAIALTLLVCYSWLKILYGLGVVFNRHTYAVIFSGTRK